MQCHEGNLLLDHVLVRILKNLHVKYVLYTIYLTDCNDFPVRFFENIRSFYGIIIASFSKIYYVRKIEHICIYAYLYAAAKTTRTCWTFGRCPRPWVKDAAALLIASSIFVPEICFEFIYSTLELKRLVFEIFYRTNVVEYLLGNLNTN